MTNDTRNLLRALDEVPPPAQWDDIVAAASEPGASPLPIRTDSNPRRRVVLVAAVLLIVIAGATAIGLAVRSDRQVEVTSTPASDLVARYQSPEPQQEEGPSDAVRWEGGVKAIIYLDPNTSDELREALQALLDDDPAVERFEYLDKAAAYEEFRTWFKDAPELTDEVDPEILPTSFKLVPVEASSESVQRIKEAYDGAPGVYLVVIAPDL